jgi:hypothetical protein
MKKARSILLVLSIVAMLVGIAAAPLADATAIALIEVRNDPHGGVIFVFDVNGRFTKPELKGRVEVQGEDANYDMGCSQVDTTTVQCTVSRKTGGKNVVIFFGGSVFWAYVPVAAPTQFCYNAYDLPYPPEGGALVAFTAYCQDTTANYGDVITLYNPDWDFTYDYEFMPQSPACYNTIIENAFYWNRCAF